MSGTREEVNKTLALSYSNEIKEIQKILGKKPEETTPEKVTENYKRIIDQFDKNQSDEWTLWSTNLPKRIVDVSKKQVEFVQSSKIIDAINYIFIAFSGILPIIVTYLSEQQGWPTLAHGLDLLFPALVGIVTQIKAGVESKRDALIAVKSPYETLLSNIIVDISQKTYSEKKDSYQGKWDKLDAILTSAKIEM